MSKVYDVRGEIRMPLKAEDVKGFEKLSVNANMFRIFLNKFYNAQGTEARATLRPISVKFIKTKDEKYLRFDYEIYGKREWTHVIGPGTWY